MATIDSCSADVVQLCIEDCAGYTVLNAKYCSCHALDCFTCCAMTMMWQAAMHILGERLHLHVLHGERLHS